MDGRTQIVYLNHHGLATPAAGKVSGVSPPGGHLYEKIASTKAPVFIQTSGYVPEGGPPVKPKPIKIPPKTTK